MSAVCSVGRAIVLGYTVPYDVRQRLWLMNDPGVIQHLGAVQAGVCEWGSGCDNVHACSDPRPNTIDRVLQHNTLLRLDVEFLGRQQIYLRVWLWLLNVLPRQYHVQRPLQVQRL